MPHQPYNNILLLQIKGSFVTPHGIHYYPFVCDHQSLYLRNPGEQLFFVDKKEVIATLPLVGRVRFELTHLQRNGFTVRRDSPTSPPPHIKQLRSCTAHRGLLTTCGSSQPHVAASYLLHFRALACQVEFEPHIRLYITAP